MKALVKGNVRDLKSYNRDLKHYEVECQVKKEKGKFILDFSNTTGEIPFPFLKHGEFTIELKPTEEEISCRSCDTCLTPIC